MIFIFQERPNLHILVHLVTSLASNFNHRHTSLHSSLLYELTYIYWNKKKQTGQFITHQRVSLKLFLRRSSLLILRSPAPLLYFVMLGQVILGTWQAHRIMAPKKQTTQVLGRFQATNQIAPSFATNEYDHPCLCIF